MDPNSKETAVPGYSLSINSLATSIFCCEAVAPVEFQSSEIKIPVKHHQVTESFFTESKHILAKSYPRVKKALHKPDSFTFVLEVTTRIPGGGSSNYQLNPSQAYHWIVPIDGNLIKIKKGRDKKEDQYDVRKCIENPNNGTTQQNWVEINSMEIRKEFKRGHEKTKDAVKYACKVEGHDKQWTVRVLELETSARPVYKIGRKKAKSQELGAGKAKIEPAISKKIAKITMPKHLEDEEQMADDEDDNVVCSIVRQNRNRNNRAPLNTNKPRVRVETETTEVKSLARGNSWDAGKRYTDKSGEKSITKNTKAAVLDEFSPPNEHLSSQKTVVKKTINTDGSRKRKAEGVGVGGGPVDECQEENIVKRRKLPRAAKIKSNKERELRMKREVEQIAAAGEIGDQLALEPPPKKREVERPTTKGHAGKKSRRGCWSADEVHLLISEIDKSKISYDD
ncbi:hypothetical protein OIDMADRAFT_27789 [Oidiodendron maius Zn]|uniref:Uncharacterized protein n=1 Tax=Oidiodendron maius (strain Zn) TaxID=913774 RepID=A0A0C3HH38_OIDMZ|nr:hypothetical protein OIDMADRAFT_27789 [Oidiodendron maius Zn]